MQHYRLIDFRRNKDGVPGKVDSIQYDPNRTCRVALVHYADGDKRFISRAGGARGRSVGAERRFGSSRGGQLPADVGHSARHADPQHRVAGRSRGSSLQVGGFLGRAGGSRGAVGPITLPSGEIRRVPAACRATIGAIGNSEHMNVGLGKAGRKRWMGIRPHVRRHRHESDRPSARWR